MNRNIIIGLLIIVSFIKGQFSNVEVSLDTRNINKSYYFLLEDFKKEIQDYYEITVFSEDDLDLEISIKIQVVIESITKKNQLMAFLVLNG